jgi:hypothetical protein
LESAWAKLFTFAVEDAAEEPTTCRKKDAPPAATENPQKSDATHGKTKKSQAKEYAKMDYFSSCYLNKIKGI